MSKKMSLKEVLETMLNKYRDTSLPHRLKEAIMLTSDLETSAYWVRESDDIVNIVWLTDNDVRDITWFPDDRLSTFDVTRYSAIAGYEIREATDVAKGRFGVAGNYLVSVYSIGEYAHLYWVASNRREEDELRNFLAEFVKKLG